jgi:hypothetical protein
LINDAVTVGDAIAVLAEALSITYTATVVEKPTVWHPIASGAS